jgi:hypothetical protein
MTTQCYRILAVEYPYLRIRIDIPDISTTGKKRVKSHAVIKCTDGNSILYVGANQLSYYFWFIIWKSEGAKSADVFACWKVDDTVLFKFNISRKDFIELVIRKCIKNIMIFIEILL